MKKHIIFDFDDTIAASYELNQNIFLEVIKNNYNNVDEDYVRMIHRVNRGSSMHSQFSKVIKKFKIPVTIDLLEKQNNEIQLKRSNEIKLFNGVIDLIKSFKSSGKILSICTNRELSTLLPVLKKYKIKKYFDNIISCKDIGYEKPHPYCILELIKKYPNINKSEIIYFGDSKTDADFAINAGVEFLVIDHYINLKQFYVMAVSLFSGGEDELLVQVDSKNRDIGAIFRQEAHSNPNTYHRSACVMVFNSKGEIILNKRSVFKLMDKGKWDMAGGHQDYGQTIDQTAKMELLEEMGIKGKLKLLDIELRKEKNQNEYSYTYYIIHDGPYNYQTQEVEEIKAFNCNDILNGKYDKKFKFLKYIKTKLNKYKYIWEALMLK